VIGLSASRKPETDTSQKPSKRSFTHRTCAVYFADIKRSLIADVGGLKRLRGTRSAASVTLSTTRNLSYVILAPRAGNPFAITMLKLTRQRLLELAKFGIVGLLCACLSIAVLMGLTELAQVNYLVSYFITFLFANACGYVLNGRFTFHAPNRMNHKSFAIYVLVNGVSLAINSLILRTLVEVFGIWYVTATIAIAVVNAPINFIAHRALSYRVNAIT
jgi:putative flippase GtrA